MATYTIYADTSDGRIQSSNGTYSTARSGGTFGVTTSLTNISTGQYFSSPTYYCYEAFVSFDTSTVPGVVSSVTLSLYANTDSSTTDFTMNVRQYDWGATLESGDWIAGADLSNYTLLASKTTSGLSTAAYTDFTSESAFLTATTNPVRLVVSSDRVEAGTTPSGNEYVIFYSANQSGTTNDPKLVIVADPSPIGATLPPRIPVEADY